MTKFTTCIIAVMMFILSIEAVYYIYSAYNMSTIDQVTCIAGLNDSTTCRVALAIESLND